MPDQRGSASRLAMVKQAGPATGVFLLAEGDSMTDLNISPQGAEKYSEIVRASFTPPMPGGNTAVTASKVSDLVTRAATVDSTKYDASKAHNLLSVLIGYNDWGQGRSAATYVADLKAYCLARKAFGWKVIVLTPLPATFGFNTFRASARALILADPSFYDALADVGADGVFGADAACDSTTYYSDGVHPTALTNTLMVPYVLAAIVPWAGTP